MGLQHKSGMLLTVVLLYSALGAAEPRAVITVATDDTAVQVEAGADGLALAALKGLSADHDWLQSKAVQQFVQAAELDGQSTPLRWQFKRSESQDGPPRRRILVFVNERPPLELHSIWQAEPGPGPVEHSLLIRNTGTSPVLLPWQGSLVFARPGESLQTNAGWR